MKTIEKANIIFNQSITEAQGYIQLAMLQTGDNTKMIAAALAALRRFSDDDELVDAMEEDDEDLFT